jgi:hypothetical protein
MILCKDITYTIFLYDEKEKFIPCLSGVKPDSYIYEVCKSHIEQNVGSDIKTKCLKQFDQPEEWKDLEYKLIKVNFIKNEVKDNPIYTEYSFTYYNLPFYVQIIKNNQNYIFDEYLLVIKELNVNWYKFFLRLLFPWIEIMVDCKPSNHILDCIYIPNTHKKDNLEFEISCKKEFEEQYYKNQNHKKYINSYFLTICIYSATACVIYKFYKKTKVQQKTSFKKKSLSKQSL